MIETSITIKATQEEAIAFYDRLGEIVEAMRSLQKVHDYAERNWSGRMSDIGERLYKMKSDFNQEICNYVKGDYKAPEQDDEYICI